MGLFDNNKQENKNEDKIQYKMYSMRDKLSGYQPPVPFINDETAIRWFKTQCLENPTIKNQPEDFELYYLGDFDTGNGIFYNCNTLELIAKGENYVI